jgi:Haem-binding uptake, Tiki superfamily, ChaN
MASTTNLRDRRSAGQLHALAGVEREIRAQDSHGRHKYLREFNQAFRNYNSLLDSEQIQNAIQAADIVLIGDYHALPAAQRYAACLMEQRAMAGDRPIVLGVETIFARDQHILDEWWRREIDERELRQRVRFDLDWGYDWDSFYELLVTAREHGDAVYGLDCMPRNDLRKIGARDRHAAAKIVEIHERHPNAVILTLFGESHLAPTHLPQALRQAMPGVRLLTILQNIDALYWRAAGERVEKVEGVSVSDDVLCVFNATPLEKYESYRLRLDQWSHCEETPDFAPTIYNLIDSLAEFFEMNRYSPHNGTQPKFLVDLLPEVYGGESDAMLRGLLSRHGVDEQERETMLANVDERGSAYFPHVNAFYVREFRMMHVAEDAARFLHQACMGLPRRINKKNSNRSSALGNLDNFYAGMMEHAVAYFGSRVLYPSRPDTEAVHAVPLSRAACEKAAQEAIRPGGSDADATAQEWGYHIGNEIYRAYLAGRVSRSDLRQLFLVHLYEQSVARKTAAAVIARLREMARSTRS